MCPLLLHFQHSASLWLALNPPFPCDLPWTPAATSVFHADLSCWSSMERHSDSSIRLSMTFPSLSMTLACADDILMALIKGQYDFGNGLRMTMTRSKSVSPTPMPASCSWIWSKLSRCIWTCDSSLHFCLYICQHISTLMVSAFPSCFMHIVSHTSFAV